MKKKISSRFAFFNPRVLIALIIFGAGIFLALVGFGTFSTLFAQPNGGSGSPVKISSGTTASFSAPAPSSSSSGFSPSGQNEDVQLSPADRNGRFVYLIEFTEAGLL